MFNPKSFKTMKKLFFLQMVMPGIFISCMFSGNLPVKQAYELRMTGKVDEAKVILKGILERDSTNAMAHYEMARLNDYMFTGGGNIKIDDILASAKKAVTYDPKNVSYAYFMAIASFGNAYMAMQMGQEDIKPYIDETAAAFDKVLALKPDYHEATLYLVEIYGLLPPDMGGDSSKAAAFAEKLSEANGYFGAKARSVLAPEGTDQVKFWQDLLVLNGNKPEYLMEAGKACLYAEDPENAEKYFDEAIKSDPANNVLILDLARYHLYSVMQNKELASTELPIAKQYIEEYLDTQPEPIVPLKAYSLGWLARIEMFQGNQSESEKRMDEAKALDPYFSRATGIPALLLFDPPDQISHHFFSFFRPF